MRAGVYIYTNVFLKARVMSRIEIYDDYDEINTKQIHIRDILPASPLFLPLAQLLSRLHIQPVWNPTLHYRSPTRTVPNPLKGYSAGLLKPQTFLQAEGHRVTGFPSSCLSSWSSGFGVTARGGDRLGFRV